MKQSIAKTASDFLSEKLKCEVSFGNVYVGLINHLDIEDVCIYDQSRETLLKSAHIGAEVSLKELFKKRIQLKHLELFKTEANLYKEDKDSTLNFQFIIDALNGDSTEEAGLDLLINTLIVRDLNLEYNVRNVGQTPRRFNADHVSVKDFDANLRINRLTKDSIDVRIRNISFREKCGLAIQRLAFHLISGTRQTTVHQFRLETPRSFLKLSDFVFFHSSRDRKGFLNGTLNDLKLEARVTPSEFQPFVPELNNLNSECYDVEMNCNKSSALTFVSTSVDDSRDENNFCLNARSTINTRAFADKRLDIRNHIQNLSISPRRISAWLKVFTKNEPPAFLEKMDNLHHTGDIDFIDHKVNSKGTTRIQNGELTHKLCLSDNSNFEADVSTNQIDLGLFANSKTVGNIHGKCSLKGDFSKKDFKMLADVGQLTLNGYPYKNIHVEGAFKDDALLAKASINDPNAIVKLEGACALNDKQAGGDGGFLQNVRQLAADINVEQFNPTALNLAKDIGNAVFNTHVTASCDCLSPFPTGQLMMRRFTMQRDSTKHTLDSLSLSVSNDKGTYRGKLVSDLADVHVVSNTDFMTLINHFKQQFNGYVSLFDNAPHNRAGSAANFNIQFKKTDLWKKMLKMPLKIEENAHVDGSIDTRANKLRLTALFPAFELFGSKYNDFSIFLQNKKDSLAIFTQTNRLFNEDNVKIEVNATAANNDIRTDIMWKDFDNDGFRGELSALTTVGGDKNKEDVKIKLYPSNMLINNAEWTINQASVDVSGDDFHIHNFRIGHEQQFISMHTEPTHAGGKILDVQLNDIDLDYVFNLLDFHPVYFSGKASGRVVTSDLNQKKDFNADLVVNNFLFNYGKMGTLKVKGGWRDDEKRVLIDAITKRTPEDSTLIKGYVDIDQDCLDLNITSKKTSVEFLRFYLGSIFKNLSGYCDGHIRVFGPLDSINLAGDERIDSLYLYPVALNTPFMINNDSLHFRPGRFIFDHVMLRDHYGNPVTIDGEVNHDYLKDFTYKFKFDYNHALIYDWNNEETTGFWGTVYATGNAHMYGTTDEVHINVDVTPDKKTQFVYDSSNTEASENNGFIRFRKVPGHTDKHDSKKKDDEKKDNSTDIFLNFRINAVPAADFTIITDNKTGDNMNLNGNGELHASFYNKGRFLMYGTYTIDHGFYKITIQDIIHKTFKMQKGGTLRFNGEPFDGDIDMRGTYNVSSVSLSDLNLGGIMKNSTTSVDCILNFKGKAGLPKVSFDIDFPSSIGLDERKMVHNIISSQGDMTMQVIYLLSVGRFYTYDYDTFTMAGTQEQSSLAMNSLLANTLSGQFNNFLSNAFHVENWNFGTNFSTGRMGWNDMEVEGMLSGSLLKNRLLFDGKFGYRDKTTSTYSNDFVGDFNLRYLLNKSGTISLKAYSETNDRYFTKSSLTTNGAGILFQRDFNSLRDFFVPLKKEGTKRKKNSAR